MPGILLEDDEKKEPRFKRLFKGKNKWLIYIGGGGMAIMLIAMALVSGTVPEIKIFPEPTPTPIPPPDILSLKVGVDVIQNPYAHGQNVIRIVKLGGPEIGDINEIYFLPISPNNNMQSRVIPTVSKTLISSGFRSGDIIYLYPTMSGYEISKNLPNYTDSIDFLSGAWTISVMDVPTKYGLGDYGAIISSSKTHYVNGETLTDAVSSAEEYDTIIITGKLYKERLVITTPLRLISRSNSVIDGGGIGSIISIQANDVEISGFELQNSGSADGGITVFSNSGINIHNNRIHHCYIGIWLHGATLSFVKENTIYENDVDGIMIDNGAVQNTVMYNTLLNNKHNGITVTNSDYNKITENIASGNKNLGIEIINYKALHNICEYNNGLDEFECSDAVDRTKVYTTTPTVVPRTRPTPTTVSSEDSEEIIWEDIYSSEGVK